MRLFAASPWVLGLHFDPLEIQYAHRDGYGTFLLLQVL